jgi:long-chain acyl-CoA synthetase
MTEPKRLFDCISLQLEKFPKSDMLAGKENGAWRTYSTTEVHDNVNRLTAGLLQLGISGNDMTTENRDKVAIISNNRPEWLIADMAVQQSGAILVPIYPTTSINEIEFIFNDAAVKCVFVSSDELLEKIKEVQPKVASLKHIFTFNPIEGATHWTNLLQPASEDNLAKVEISKSKVSESDLVTIIYTSGTTGVPKGVMLSHSNIVRCIFLSKESFPFDDNPNNKALSFLPLNHIFEKAVSYIYMFSGYSIYFAESLDTIAANLRELKPDIFTK